MTASQHASHGRVRLGNGTCGVHLRPKSEQKTAGQSEDKISPNSKQNQPAHSQDKISPRNKTKSSGQSQDKISPTIKTKNRQNQDKISCCSFQSECRGLHMKVFISSHFRDTNKPLGIKSLLQLPFVGLMDSQAFSVNDSDDEVESNQHRFCGLHTISASETSALRVFDDPVLPSFSLAKPVDSTGVNFPEPESDVPIEASQSHDGGSRTNRADPVNRILSFDGFAEEAGFEVDDEPLSKKPAAADQDVTESQEPAIVAESKEPTTVEDIAESKEPTTVEEIAESKVEEIAESKEPATVEDIAESKKPSADQDGDFESKKRKAQEDLDNPKFAKGTRMNGLSPSSQERLKEVRKLRAIQVSDQWHAKWESKGVRKESPLESTPESGTQAAPAEDRAELPAESPAESPRNAESRPRTLNDARVFGQQICCFHWGLLHLNWA